MRDYLNNMGFHVLAPTLPGQGRAPSPVSGGTEISRAEYYKYIPSIENNGGEEYRKFVDDMNVIMEKAPGVHVVGGLSVGGALAVGAVLQAPGLYQKAIILAPFFTVPPDNFWRPIEPKDGSKRAQWQAFYANAKLKIANDVRRVVLMHKTDWIPKDKQELRWGDSCYQQNAGGRAGICDTHMKNIAAVVQYGDIIHDLASSKKHAKQFKGTPTLVQFVGVEYDDGSDTRATKDMMNLLTDRFGFKSNICFYRGTPHSFLSKYDHPGMDMHWLPAFHEQVQGFIGKGEFFAEAGTSAELKKDASIIGGAVQVAVGSNKKPEDYYPLCRQ